MGFIAVSSSKALAFTAGKLTCAQLAIWATADAQFSTGFFFVDYFMYPHAYI
jgi:hypothetical protein